MQLSQFKDSRSHNSNSRSHPIKVLDLFCCSGVGAEGYAIAGCHVTGVDIKKPSWFPGLFLQADVMELPVWFLQQFDFIHASPPCQSFSRTAFCSKKIVNSDLVLIQKLRSLLTASGLPCVIENVVQAPIAKDFVLCGCMFNSVLIRKRAFECVNWQPFTSPVYCRCGGRHSDSITIAGRSGWTIQDAHRLYGTLKIRKRQEFAEAIPPFYTAWIFEQWLSNSQLSTQTIL